MEENYYKKYEPIFGNWYIKRKIGKGSFGTVFEITREEWGEIFSSALKVISIPSSQDDFDSVMRSDDMTKEEATAYFKGVVEDFNKECVLMSKLKGNTNIVNYEDHVIIPHEDGMGWDILIRMELLAPLTEHFKKSDVDETQVVKLGIDICKALELCEKKSIIHRDIKPENIFVSAEGDYKLGDFGVAKIVEGTTGSATTVGTAEYAAPEVVIGRGGYKSNVDTYSLGMVMYKLLNSNRLPFLPLPPEAVGYSHRQEAKSRRLTGEAFPNPVGASPELSKIIKKSCAYNAEERYVTPGDMRNDLEVLLRGDALYEERIQIVNAPIIKTDTVNNHNEEEEKFIINKMVALRKNIEIYVENACVLAEANEIEKIAKERKEAEKLEKIRIESARNKAAEKENSYINNQISEIYKLVDKKEYEKAQIIIERINKYCAGSKLPVATTKSHIKNIVKIGKEITFANEVWIVLNVDENRALLLKRDALAAMCYNANAGEVTWAQCTLRHWLNDKYLFDVFSKDERDAICKTNLINQDNDEFLTNAGSNTSDKIFLLSLQEVKSLDGSLLKLNSERSLGRWWLRTPGYTVNDAAFVWGNGDVSTYGAHANSYNLVRPVMWVDISVIDKK